MDYEERLVGEILKDCLKDMGLGGALDLCEIERSWEDIVGKRVSRRSRPTKMEGGRLYIATPAPVWSNEINLMREEIKHRIAEKTGIWVGDIVVKTEGAGKIH